MTDEKTQKAARGVQIRGVTIMKTNLHFKAGALVLTMVILSSTILAGCSSVSASGKVDLNSLTLAQIEEQGWSLNPGRYVGVADRVTADIDFSERLQELTEEYEILTSESASLEDLVNNNIRLILGAVNG